MEFFSQLFYSFNRQFTPKTTGDGTQLAELLACLSAESKESVNDIVNKVLAERATETREPQEYGFMFGRRFNDLDGHIQEICGSLGHCATAENRSTRG